MVHTSEVVNEYLAQKSIFDSKLLKFNRAFFSSLSLNLIDTGISFIANIVGSIIEKNIQNTIWKEKLLLCIKAADSAALSLEEITEIIEILTEILKTSSIDIRRFILQKEYLDEIACEIVCVEGSGDTDRLARILTNVFYLLSDTLRNTPEFTKTVSEILREHDQTINNHEERIRKMECKPQDVEMFLQNLPTLRLSKKAMPFAFNYHKLQDVRGREKQIEKLTTFAEDDNRRFLFWVVTGPAGVGKSKLVFHFGRIYNAKKDWLVRELDRTALQSLCQKTNWTTDKNILLIIDYANEQEKLTELLSILSSLREENNSRKVRVVLVAREGTSLSLYNPHKNEFPQWYLEISKDARYVNEHLYLNEFMDLEGLPITECIRLHKDFAENHLQREVFAEDEEKVRSLIEKEVLDDNGLARPLYALFVIDSYYNAPETRAWDLESLQKQIYERDWTNWQVNICSKRNRNEKLFVALTNLLLYATIFGRWESNTTLPEPLSVDCKIVFDAVSMYSTDYKTKCFRLLTGRSVVINGEPALVRLTPDMVGEYYVLRRLSSFDNNTLCRWAELIASRMLECRDFFVRAIQDFGNHVLFINIFLKLFRSISECLSERNVEIQKAFASVLETFFHNYKGNENDQIYRDISGFLKEYIEEHKDHCVYAAELALLFHENRPHIGNERRMQHFKRVEKLYKMWPNSLKIICSYVSFLGDIVASKIGAHTPKYSDDYIKKFENLSNLAELEEYDLKRCFVPVLIKIIERSISIHDWDKFVLFEKQFLRNVMLRYDDELALDFISRFDSVIVTLAKERHSLFPSSKLVYNLDEKQLKDEIDSRIEKAIDFFKQIIDDLPNPSVNFIWTYIGKLAMLTKNLFINNCNPHSEFLFQYMINKLQRIYEKYYFNNKNILTWRVSRVLDEFCNAKSDAIPYSIRAQCILKKPM